MPNIMPEKTGFCESTGVSLYERNAESHWEKLSKWFAIIILGVFPFLMGARKYENITLSRYIWFCVLTLAYVFGVLLILVGFSLSKKSWVKRKAEGFQRLDISQWLMIAYVGWAAISSFVSPYRQDTWLGQGRYEGLLTIILYCLIFVLLSFWGEYTNLYAYAMGIMAAAIALLSFLQMCGIDFLTPEGYTVWDTKFFATIGNIDCVSGIGAIVIPALFCAFVLLNSAWRYICLSGFALYFYLQLFVDVDSGKMGLLLAFVVVLPFLLDRWKRMMRTAVGFGTLLLVYAAEKLLPITQKGIALVFTKKAAIALILGAILVVLGIVFEKEERSLRWSEKQMRRLVWIVLLILLAAAVILVYTYQGNSRLLLEIQQVLHGELADNAGNRRGIVWKLSVQFIKEMPIFGSGPDTYLARSYPYYQSGQLIEVYDFAHNDFLQVGVCLGLGGLLIYVAWIISMAIRLLKKARTNPLLLIFGSAMVGYIGHVFFSFSIALVTPLFWVLAGLGNKCLRQTKEETA